MSMELCCDRYGDGIIVLGMECVLTCKDDINYFAANEFSNSGPKGGKIKIWKCATRSWYNNIFIDQHMMYP